MRSEGRSSLPWRDKQSASRERSYTQIAAFAALEEAPARSQQMPVYGEAGCESPVYGQPIRHD